MAAPTLPTLVPTAYSSTTGTAYTTTTVGNIDNTVASPDGAFIVAGADSSASIFYAFTDTPTDFVKMLTLTYNIRYKIVGVSGDTETLYVRVYKSDKSTALTDEMTVVQTTAAISITNKGNTSFTGVVAGTKADWDGAFLCIRTLHNAYKGADGSVWSIDEVELNGTYDAPPTVALNTPANNATNQIVLTELKFTGTDPNAANNTVEYNVQVDTANSFDSQQSSIDSYPDSNWNGNGPIYSPYQKGQSFTGNGNIIVKAQFSLVKTTPNPAYNFQAKIYAHSGVFGTSSVGTGSPLAVSDIVSESVLSAASALIDFNFSGANQIILENGTNYVIMLFSDDPVAGAGIGTDSTSPTHGGNYVLYNSTTLAWIYDNTVDLIFYLFSISPLLNKLSTADAGFTAGHPFDSGSQITYTIQSALNNGIQYFWRVRATDPSGSATWGAWSDIYNFTTVSAITFIPRMIIF